MKKRVLSFILALVIILSAFPLAVNAARRPDYYTKYYTRQISGVNMAELENYLYKKFTAFETEFDISQFNISATPENRAALHALIIEMTDCFHVEKYNIMKTPDKIVSFANIKYCCSPAEYKSRLAECESIRKKLTYDINKTPGLGDKEKALLLHDRLADICSYDYDAYNENSSNADIPHNAATMYGALVLGKAVCQGYSSAYKYLLEAVGVPCSFAQSDKLNHMWNIVYIDDVPYHVDVTWDDPSWGEHKWNPSGRMLHNNFLLSTKALRHGVGGSSPHNAGDYFSAPSDTRYDNYFWQNSGTSFQLLNGKLYYIDSTDRSIYSYSGDKRQKLFTIENEWEAGKLSHWPGNYSALASNGRSLYFNTDKEIKKLDINDGSAPEVIFAYKSEPGKFINIFGLTYKDGSLIYDVSSSPNFTDSKLSGRYSLQIKEIIKGDADEDGSINAADARLILRCSVELEVFLPRQLKASDVDGDGNITAADARKVLRVSVNLEKF